MLAAQRTCTHAQHGGRGAADGVQAKQTFLVTKMHLDAATHHLAASALGQQRQLHAIGQYRGLGALVNVRGRRVKAFGLGRSRVTLVVFNHFGHVDPGRRWCALRLVGGNVGAQRAVIAQQVAGGDPVDIGQGQVTHPVATQKKQPPVALCDGLGQGHTHLLGVGKTQVPAGEVFGLGTVQFILRHRLRANRLNRLQHHLARLVHVLAWRQRQAKHGEAGVLQPLREAKSACRQLFVHDARVQPTRGRVAQNQAQGRNSSVVGVGAGWDVVQRVQGGRAAHAAHGHAFLAVLRRIQRVESRQFAGGVLQWPKILTNPLAHLDRVKLAGDDHGGIGGAVIGAVELLQAFDVHAFHVGARSNRALAIVVPLVGGTHDPLKQDAPGVVFAALHLVAHHGHFGVQVLAGDEAVDHGVSLPSQVPLQVVLVGGETGEVVGAVQPGRTIGAQPPFGELGPDLAVPRRALEQQVLQQMRHAGFAVVLVFAADPVGHVDGGGGPAVVLNQQHLQAVGQAVLDNPFHRGDLGHAGRQGLAKRRGCGEQAEAQYHCK